jgi:integrase
VFCRQQLCLPVVLSRKEVVAVLAHMRGMMWIIGMLLRGSGLRLQEWFDLRVKDIDFDRHQIAHRSSAHGCRQCPPCCTRGFRHRVAR